MSRNKLFYQYALFEKTSKSGWELLIIFDSGRSISSIYDREHNPGMNVHKFYALLHSKSIQKINKKHKIEFFRRRPAYFDGKTVIAASKWKRWKQIWKKM